MTGDPNRDGEVKDIARSAPGGPERSTGGGSDATARRSTPTPELRERMERLARWRDRFLTAHGLGERLELLVAFGLTDRDIAKAMPSTQPRSVRRWRTVGPPTTRAAERWEPIDDLCAIVGYFLANATYDEAGIVAWLRSRHAALAHQRPLDVLGAGNFEAVRTAAAEELEVTKVDEEDLIPVSPRPAQRIATTSKE